MRLPQLSDVADKARYVVNSSNLVLIIFKSLEAHYVTQGKPRGRGGSERSQGESISHVPRYSL